MRQQRALEKADVLVDKHERKVADSKARSKKIQARAKDWEELNEELVGKQVAGGAGVTKAADAGDDADDGTDEAKMADAPPADLEQPLPVRAVEDDITHAESATADIAEEVDEVT